MKLKNMCVFKNGSVTDYCVLIYAEHFAGDELQIIMLS